MPSSWLRATRKPPFEAGGNLHRRTNAVVIRLLPALFATLATIGCSSGEADRGATVRIDTIAENRIEVVNTGAPTWTTETAWKLEEDLRLGTVQAGEGDPEQFGDISSVTTDSRGRIYVLDTMAKEIRVFRPDGTWSASELRPLQNRANGH